MRMDRVDVVLIELLLYSLYQFEKPDPTKKYPFEAIQYVNILFIHYSHASETSVLYLFCSVMLYRRSWYYTLQFWTIFLVCISLQQECRLLSEGFGPAFEGFG